MCCQLWRCPLGCDGFLGRPVQHGSSCDFLVFPDLVCWAANPWRQFFLLVSQLSTSFISVSGSHLFSTFTTLRHRCSSSLRRKRYVQRMYACKASLDVVAPVVLSVASQLFDPDVFSCCYGCICCCGCCCCVAGLCCRYPSHCVSWCTCAVNAANVLLPSLKPECW